MQALHVRASGEVLAGARRGCSKGWLQGQGTGQFASLLQEVLSRSLLSRPGQMLW